MSAATKTAIISNHRFDYYYFLFHCFCFVAGRRKIGEHRETKIDREKERRTKCVQDFIYNIVRKDFKRASEQYVVFMILNKKTFFFSRMVINNRLFVVFCLDFLIFASTHFYGDVIFFPSINRFRLIC